METEKPKSEIYVYNENCTIEFFENGSLQLHGDCDGLIIQPEELELLNRVKKDIAEEQRQ